MVQELRLYWMTKAQRIDIIKIKDAYINNEDGEDTRVMIDDR